MREYIFLVTHSQTYKVKVNAPKLEQAQELLKKIDATTDGEAYSKAVENELKWVKDEAGEHLKLSALRKAGDL